MTVAVPTVVHVRPSVDFWPVNVVPERVRRSQSGGAEPDRSVVVVAPPVVSLR